MLGNDPFYNRTIRKIVVAFGTVFNDIHLVRYTKDGLTAKEIIKVPLNWGAKEKYLTRLTSDPTLTKSIATTVPRISFDMTGMSYDSSRKLPSTMRNFSANDATSAKAQYVPVPYNFNFSLSIYVRNTEDGTQILEQILPFFTPDFSVTVDFIPSMEPKYDMPIILNSVSNEVDYEGDMMSTRLIIWNLEFTAKGHIWPPIKTGKVITVANTNVFFEPSEDTQKVYVDFANGVGRFSDSESIRVENKELFGKVSYFSNTNNGILIVNSLNGHLLEAGDVVRGDFTGATYTISRADVIPLQSTKITTRPNPIDATPDDEFGFSETFTYYTNPINTITITQNVPDITALVGANVSFSVTATAIQGSVISYQWYSGNTDLPISGATTRLLSLTNVQLSDSGKTYYVVLSSPNATTVTSRYGVLTVQ